MAELLDDGTDDESLAGDPGEHAAENDGSHTHHRPVRTWNPQAYMEETGLQLEDLARPNAKKHRDPRPLKFAGSNFTFDVAIVATLPDGLTYIPVRCIMDTGCEKNMVAEEISTRAGIKEGQMKHLNGEYQFHGLDGSVYEPEFKVSLTWYLGSHMKSRVNDFFVVRDAPFDVLLGSHWIRNSRSSGAALILQSRRKTKGDLP
jgi:hypothetical protein